MTWTYVDPTSSLRDEVRFRLGDTDPDDPQLTDAEIGFLLTENGDDTWAAAAAGADQRAAHFARRATDEQLGRRREIYGDRAKAYRELAQRLRSGPSRSGVTAAAPRATNVRLSTRAAAETDADRAPTTFRTGMMSND